jgi:hypothetical protein
LITLGLNVTMPNSTEIRMKNRINSAHTGQCFEVRSMEVAKDAVPTADLTQCQKKDERLRMMKLAGTERGRDIF